MIEFFKSLGVTHHGYYILGQKPKRLCPNEMTV